MTDLSALKLGSASDPYRAAAERGWDITDASELGQSVELEADVVIVGTGAGGGTAAETLSKAGLSVIMLEAGPLKSSSYFDMNEREAYRDLYQEGTGRATKDGAIPILQGRSVGGSTTVNWTSSFRTPEPTLNYWAENMGVKGCTVAEMAPYFERMEERLNIAPWTQPPNPNNETLRRAAQKMGYEWKVIPRNVRGCLNLGYCGLGCPVDAKQSMLVTTIPGALDHKAKLIHRARVERVLFEGGVVQGVEAVALDKKAKEPTAHKVTVRAKRTVLAGGAINNPGVLLRSKVPDPHERVGKRTFLHPTTLSIAIFEQGIHPFYGAPQSIYSDHFQWLEVSGPAGFKLEVPPLQPGFASGFFGPMTPEQLTEGMDQLAHNQWMIALLRDGFHEESQGGTVELDKRDRPLIDYPLNDYLLDGVKRAFFTMVEMQFAVGAKRARPGHKRAPFYSSWNEAKSAMAQLPIKPYLSTVGSAHVMGGCGMGEDETRSVVDSAGKYHQLDNLYVMDGSLFPTSIGANPQLSIYGLVLKLSEQLASQLTA